MTTLNIGNKEVDMFDKPKFIGIFFAVWMVIFGAIGTNAKTPPPISNPIVQKPKETLPIEEKKESIPIDPELIDVQVPIIKENRKYNESGVQCVWCSLENLARHHKVVALYDLTDIYKQATGPGYVGYVLKSRNIKYKQIQSSKEKGIAFIKEYVVEKKFGVGIGLQGIHMINLVHFDEEQKIVKVIDNGGPNALKIQTWTMDQFMNRFDGWVITIFPPDHNEETSEIITNPNCIYGKGMSSSDLR
jgi:hypothetical protein